MHNQFFFSSNFEAFLFIVARALDSIQ